MLETENMYLCMDLSKADWHSYEDSFGTLEEKRLIRYIESIYPKLTKKYHNISLVRRLNSKDHNLLIFYEMKAIQV